MAGSQIITALQSIASRNTDPVEQVVVSVTSIESSSNAFNVIPQFVHLKGTVRTLTDENRDMAEDRLKVIATQVGAAMGAEVEVKYYRGYPVMANHDAQTDFAAEVATSINGSCDEAPLVMGGEDFAYMLLERPGAYILLGNGDSAPVHHPKYNFNDDIIPLGCSWFAEVVERRMPAA